MPEWILDSSSETHTFELGRQIGTRLQSGDVLALWGELGAGKTLLARAISRGLGIPSSIPVTSPTFTFINEYEGRLHIYHLDLYRVTGGPDELETLPWQEALFGSGVAIIEWPDRLGEVLPEERWDIHLEITGSETRRITIKPIGEINTTRFTKWSKELHSLLSIGDYN